MQADVILKEPLPPWMPPSGGGARVGGVRGGRPPPSYAPAFNKTKNKTIFKAENLIEP